MWIERIWVVGLAAARAEARRFCDRPFGGDPLGETVGIWELGDEIQQRPRRSPLKRHEECLLALMGQDPDFKLKGIRLA